MAGSALERFSVLHHRLDGVGVEGSGETFRFTFDASDDGHCHHFACKVRIDVQHLACSLFRFFASGVGGVPFLPEEFGGAEEEACAHFPAHHVAPLVAAERQVAPGVNPFSVGVPNRGFRSRADDEFLFEFRFGVHDHASVFVVSLETIVGDDGAFLGKSLDVVSLFGEETLRDEHGEVGVLHARFFESCVEVLLHTFPDGVAVGFNHHAASDVRAFGEVCFHHQFIVPAGIVCCPLGQVFQFFCHICVRFCFTLGCSVSPVSRRVIWYDVKGT